MIARHLAAARPIVEALCVETDEAIGTSHIDITTDALVGPFGPEPSVVAVHLDDAANEFVPQDSMEAHVALKDFEVGVAHAGTEDFDQGKVGQRLGDGNVPDLAVRVAGVGDQVGQHAMVSGVYYCTHLKV